MLHANLLHNVIFNVTGHPVVLVPIGLSMEGLPIGVQLVGRRSTEAELLNAAEQISRATGGFRAPPGY
jgi:amidase